MSMSLNSRQMCQMILSSSEATEAEKRVAQIRLDELDGGDESQVYIRLDSADEAPDRAAIISAIKKLDPHFADHPSQTLDFLRGRLDQIQNAKAPGNTASTAKQTAKLDAHDGYMDGMARVNAVARYEQRRQSAIAYCKGDEAAEKAAVARLDASIAREAELVDYRAGRAEQTKLDANTDQVSPVVTAQLAYYRRMRGLGSSDDSGPKSAA